LLFILTMCFDKILWKAAADCLRSLFNAYEKPVR